MQHRLGATEVDELLAAYLAGERVNDLAARFGVHRTTVMVHLARRGAARPTRDWDTDALTTAAQLYNQGLSLAAVADRFEINPSTVANRFRRAGVTIRPRRGWAWYQTLPMTHEPLPIRRAQHAVVPLWPDLTLTGGGVRHRRSGSPRRRGTVRRSV